jgi:hypothetical protein
MSTTRRDAANALDLARKARNRLDKIDLRTTRGAVRDELREARADAESLEARLESVLQATAQQ